MFNGYADQYDHRPLTAEVGERVRIWVLDAGPEPAARRSTSSAGSSTPCTRRAATGCDGAAPAPAAARRSALGPAQGGFVELTFPQAGHYPFVSHVMIDAERGAHGIFDGHRA